MGSERDVFQTLERAIRAAFGADILRVFQKLGRRGEELEWKEEQTFTRNPSGTTQISVGIKTPRPVQMLHREEPGIEVMPDDEWKRHLRQIGRRLKEEERQTMAGRDEE